MNDGASHHAGVKYFFLPEAESACGCVA